MAELHPDVLKICKYFDSHNLSLTIGQEFVIERKTIVNMQHHLYKHFTSPSYRENSGINSVSLLEADKNTFVISEIYNNTTGFYEEFINPTIDDILNCKFVLYINVKNSIFNGTNMRLYIHIFCTLIYDNFNIPYYVKCSYKFKKNDLKGKKCIKLSRFDDDRTMMVEFFENIGGSGGDGLGKFGHCIPVPIKILTMNEDEVEKDIIKLNGYNYF